jgi:Heavy-metal-associated domain
VVLQQPSPHELVIGGMTCAACAARVQAQLNRLDGITLSSAFVVWNSLRLRRFVPRPV